MNWQSNIIENLAWSDTIINREAKQKVALKIAEKVTITSLFLVSLSFSINVEAQVNVKDKESARIFVQKFYDWYIVFWSETVKKPDRESVLEVAIKKHPEYFGLKLKKAIAADDSAQNKTEDDIVGLDFDPFIGQELWGNFAVGDVKKKGERYLVDIRNFEKGNSAKKPRAVEFRYVVELARLNGQWIIVNIKYPSKRGSNDILQTLKDLKRDRENHQ